MFHGRSAGPVDAARLGGLVVGASLSVIALAGAPASASEPFILESGIASWYGPGFAGKPTASGETYDPDALTAAHRTLPLGTLVRVHNHDNGRALIVRINDRGPFIEGRVIDLSRAGAEVLGFEEAGLAHVSIELLDPARVAQRHGGEVGEALRKLVARVQGTPETHRFETPAGTTADRRSETSRSIQENEPEQPWRMVPDGEGYVVQVGAYETHDNARSQAERVKALGFAARVERQQRLHRVLVGPFASFTHANIALRDLARAGFDGFLRTSRR